MAAPVVESPASKVIKTDENGVENIDFEFVLPYFEALNGRFEAKGIRSITEKDEKFLDRLLKAIQERGILEEIFDMIMIPSQLIDTEAREISKRAVPWGKIANGIFRSALGTYMLTKIDNFWPKVYAYLGEHGAKFRTTFWNIL